jgi:uncharacterized C2H2 Zn-finger protein
MVNYKCKKCAKSFIQKIDYTRHINRVNPCTLALSDNSNQGSFLQEKGTISSKIIEKEDNNEDLECRYCNKTFTRKDNLERHISDRCKSKAKADNDKEEIFKKLLAEMQEIKAENKKLITKVDMLEKAQPVQPAQLTNIANQQNIEKQQIVDKQIVNNHVKLIAFGKEDMSSIADNICKQILSKGFQSVPKLIEHIHFNKDKPEYHNVYIPNFRNNFAMVFDGDDWGLRDRDETVSQLKDEKAEFIMGKFNELMEAGELSEAAIKKLKRFINEKDEDPADTNLKNDIKMILYNKRNMILNTKKKIKLLENK